MTTHIKTPAGVAAGTSITTRAAAERGKNPRRLAT